MEKTKKELIELYLKHSKHSQYQLIHSAILNLFDEKDFYNLINNRYEEERSKYILRNIDVVDKKILDIGGNIGYFSIDFAMKGAKHIKLYEGNKDLARFAKLSVKLLKFEKKIDVKNEYFKFDDEILANDYFDIILLFNVLHHIGDDFGGHYYSKEKAKSTIIKILMKLAIHCKYLIYQMGYNWKGDIKLPLFENGTKREMIDFIKRGLSSFYQIEKIGIAERQKNIVIYNDLNDKNISRDNSLGEFLNRPIFILKSIVKNVFDHK